VQVGFFYIQAGGGGRIPPGDGAPALHGGDRPGLGAR
jgi:hypothetical protein